MRKVAGLLAGFICLIGLVFVAALLGDLFGGGTETSKGVLVGLLIFFAGVSAFGGHFARRVFSGASSRRQRELSREQRILRLAMAQQGTVTIAQIAVHTGLLVDDATEALEELVHKGVAEIDSDDDGDLFYRFPGLEEDMGNAVELDIESSQNEAAVSAVRSVNQIER
jgi:hypothetical protein